MKRKTRQPDRESTIDTLVRGLTETVRQVRALTNRANLGGDVVCSITLPLKLNFLVPSAADRDVIVQAVGKALTGEPGATVTITPDEAKQQWDVLSKGM